MFSRKKKDERREKKRHKPGMTQAEITKLEEVGIRRGFFSKMTNSGKRDKEESIQKRSISRPLSLQLSENDHSNEKDLPSVLQRANLFGQVVHSQRRTSVTSPPVSPPASGDAPPSMVRRTTEGSIKHPVPPVRRKVSTKSLKQAPSVPYDVPKPPVKALDDSYSTPHSWKQPTREAHVVSGQKQRALGPEIRQVKPRPHRTVILRKRTAGDFGVSLRRSAMIEHVNGKEEKRTVYFAEPGNAMLADMDFHDDISSRLYTGDRLIEIDGLNVENASRDEIVSRIKSAGNQVTLVVQSLHDSDEVDLDSPDSLYNISHKPEALPRLNARNNSFQAVTADSMRMDIASNTEAANMAKDDDAPKLPAAKKKELQEKAQGNPQKQISRQKSCEDKIGQTSTKSDHESKQAVRSHSVCAGNLLHVGKDKQTLVTPNELHASSFLEDMVKSEANSELSPKKPCEDMASDMVEKLITESQDLKQDTKSLQPDEGVIAGSESSFNLPTFDPNTDISIDESSEVNVSDDGEKVIGDAVTNQKQDIGLVANAESQSDEGDMAKAVNDLNGITKDLAATEEAATCVNEDTTTSKSVEIVTQVLSSDSNKARAEIDEASDLAINTDTQSLADLTCATVICSDIEKPGIFPSEVAQAEGITKEEPKQNGVPDVIHISPQPGLTWMRKEKVWFRHSDGTSSAHVVEPEGDASTEKVIEGKTRIELEQTKEVVMVPEDDVELANEAQFDRAGDVTTLRHLNESSVLHTLSQRYEGSLLYSFAGPHLISVKPPYSHAAAANNYTTKIKQTYKGSRFGDTPPHIYGIAQHAYQDMMSSLNDQCIVNLGYTGSGKTNNTRHILNYFATIGFHTNSRLTVERVLAVVDVFESLSSAATVQCKNASRCIHVYNLDFDRTGQLAALSIQAMLLEKSRLVKRPEGEANFNIFYQLLHGADTQLRRELFLLDVEQESNPLIISSFNSDPTFHQMSVKGFGSLRDSFTSLEFTPDEIKAVFYVLAACLHLGMAGAQRVSGGRFQFARADSAQKAASLLGVPAEKLSKMIFQVPASFGKRSRSSSTASLKRSGSMNLSPSNHSAPAEEAIETGQQQLDTFIIGLYSQVFRTIVSLINRSLSSSQRAQNTVSVVDTPGYQGWDTEHTNNPATYADLTFNYVQDRLHSLFHYNAFTLHKERYQQEDIDCDVIVPEDNFTSSIDLIDQPPSLGNIGAKGLLWILDEEASSPGATDESFIERLLLHYSKTNQNNGHTVVQRSQNQGRFLLHHQAGACRVEYDAAGWLNYARYNSTQTDASDALQDSKKKFISDVFGSGAEKIQGSIASLKLDGGSSSLKRVSSIRKGWSSASGAVAIKKSTCMLTKFQTDGLVDTLRRTQPHFILSFVPQPSGHEALSLDVITVRKQLCGFQLLEVARTLKQGYPEHVVFSDFRRRFDVLLRHLSSKLPSNSTSVSLMEDKEATENILKEVELNRSQFRIGASQVFFRSGVLNMLEDRRNEKVSDVMVAFQACCRGYLARKRFERKKVQVVAVRCIQRNIRKFMAIRQWPWWRLLTKVLPLVEVTRTEEELREKQAEFDLLKEKFERIQTERDELKLSNSKYETKLQDVMLHLEDQHSTASHATDMLEHERKERLRLEKLLKDAQASSIELQGRVEMVEVELAEKKLLYSEHVVSIMDSDEEIEDGQYKVKYEQAVREFNFQAKKKSQEHEDALEEAQSEKKTLERKMIQLQEELEDQRRLEQQARKKLHRINAELSDAKIHLDETASKNHELEKKQRKFDSELYAAQADATDLKTSRDRVQREKDKIVLEKKDLERELDDKSDEADSLKMKVRRIEEELEDNSTRDTDDRQMVNQLKKQIRELDAKMKDQEEELDEQANTIHTLEQARERLEMAAEQARQQRQREVEGKEDELEEMRTSYHKKIKQLELQLEEVEEERSSIQKQKRELEQEVKDSRDQEAHGHDVEMERRLRRDLKRYKALLADAQTMIDHLKADVVNKQQMKQLKAQVEDLQYTSSSAVKSRKAIELEVEDLQTQLEEVSRAKQESESRVSSLQREVHELNSKLEEDGEDTQETHRKYRNLVNQQTDDRRQLVELQASVEDLKHEKNNLEEKIAGLQNQIEYLEESTTDNATAARLESKAKDLETKLDFQKTTTRRLEVQLARAKENLDKCMSERDSHIAGEFREKEAFKRVQRQLRESKDEQAELLKREQEALQKKHDLDMEVNEHQNQIDSLQADLKLAFKRISDLQIALEELEESDIDDDSMSSSDEDDVLTQSRYGWRSRLSTTSGYSDRGRTRSSIASSRSSSVDYDSSLHNISRNEPVFSNLDEYS